MLAVLNPKDCLHISSDAKTIANILEKYASESKYPVYDKLTRKGVYRLALVRTLASSECMVMLQVNDSELGRDEFEAEKQMFKSYILSESKKLNVSINSLYIQASSDVFNGFKEQTPSELLHGTKYVTEVLNGQNFQISPHSFFQVNPSGTTVLYSLIKELALNASFKCAPEVLIGGNYVFVNHSDANPYMNPETDVVLDENEIPGIVLLDLCCGTGTIGISLAKHFKKVISVELVEDAIEDAKLNAKANGFVILIVGVDNITFICGKVENCMDSLFKHVSKADTVVAILDPPRAGIHSSVIQSIRKSNQINHLIFVACSIKSSLQNCIDLCRPTTNKFRNFPFIPKQAIPVDLFPHTELCELVLEFERNVGIQ